LIMTIMMIFLATCVQNKPHGGISSPGQTAMVPRLPRACGAVLVCCNSQRAVLAMLLGGASGMFWNMMGGWSIDSFFLGIRPVWTAMTTNVTTLTIVSLSE